MESAAWYGFDSEAYALWVDESEKNPCSKPWKFTTAIDAV
jgi:hypothetical protein